MRNRSLRVPVIMDSIAHTAFLTLHGTVRVTHQTELGGTSAESNCFRMHRDDYPPAAQEKHTVLSAVRLTPNRRLKQKTVHSLAQPMTRIDALDRARMCANGPLQRDFRLERCFVVRPNTPVTGSATPVSVSAA